MMPTETSMKFVPERAITDRSRLGRGSTLFSALGAASFAWLAFTSSAFSADADALLKEGKKLVAEKKYDEACPKLADSYKASSAPGTLIELAICHEKQGKLATAWGEFLDAETDARKAGRADLEARARANSKALEGKLPRLTVGIAQNTQGIEIAVDGQKIDLGSLGKGRPVDPGDHKVIATAPGKKPWETTVTLKQAERKTIAIPALEADPNAPANPTKPEDKPTETKPDQGTTTTDKGEPPKDEKDKPKEDPDDGKGPIHRSKRIVVDVGVTVGGSLMLLGGSLPEVTNLNYEYRIIDQNSLQANQLASCQSGGCRTLTDPSIGVPVGGQLFVGYALNETLLVGGRFFGTYLVTGGYQAFVGPSISKRLAGDKLWVGGTLLVGFGAQNAAIKGARGEVPDEWVDLNGKSEVVVPLDPSIPTTGDVGYGFTFGASGEISYRLAEFGKGKSLSTGSLLLSAWPTVLKTWHGVAVVVPVGIGYRFH